MKIEVGKSYRNRQGDKVTIAREREVSESVLYPYEDEEEEEAYTRQGK